MEAAKGPNRRPGRRFKKDAETRASIVRVYKARTDMTAPEVAGLFGISLATLKNYVSEAKEKAPEISPEPVSPKSDVQHVEGTAPKEVA